MNFVYIRGGADNSLARPERKQAVLLGQKYNKISRDNSVLLDYEKTFDEGRMTLSFMQCTRTTEG